MTVAAVDVFLLIDVYVLSMLVDVKINLLSVLVACIAAFVRYTHTTPLQERAANVTG
jgi:hypothetical protein